MVSPVNYALTTLAFLSLCASLMFLGYLIVTERKAPRFKDSIHESNTKSREAFNSQPREAHHLVSVLISARNEEKMIGKCVNSLLGQTYPDLEIVVVDDSSTDRTREIVSEMAQTNPNLRLALAGSKPQGWVGKSWPCWRGYEESRGDFLLFVDADSSFDPRAIELSINYVLENGIDMFSLSPSVVMKGIWAKSVLPIITGAINLLYPIQKVNDQKSVRAYVFGTFILVKKSAYELIGGHKRVRDEIVEDAAIARLAKSSGLKLRIERAPELVSTVWEDDLRSIYSGLERVSSSSIKSYGLVSILDAVLFFIVALYPLLLVADFLVFRPHSIIPLASLIASTLNILCFLFLDGFELKTVNGKANALTPFLYPLGSAIFTLAIATTSVKVALGRGIHWKGGTYKQSKEIEDSSSSVGATKSSSQ